MGGTFFVTQMSLKECRRRGCGGEGALEFLAFVAVYSPGTATSIIHFTNHFASHMVLGLNPFAT